MGQNISFKQERDNEYDRFAVCGLVKIPGKIELTIVGHIPREISRYVWYALEEGANIAGMEGGANIAGMEEGGNIAGKVVNGRYKPSPLFQGGLEIPIKVLVQWYNGIKILQEQVERVGYPPDGENYMDDSKEILKSLLADDIEEEEDDVTSEREKKPGNVVLGNRRRIWTKMKKRRGTLS